MSKFESPLAKQLEREMDPEYRRKQMEYTNAVKAIELAYTLVVPNAQKISGYEKGSVPLARQLASMIKEDLDKAMEILYGPPKTP